MNPPCSILVLRAGALGDFILTMPALMSLRQAYPQARLELRAHPERTALAQAAGLVDCGRDINAAEMAELFLPQDLPANLAAYFHRFDRIICFLADRDRILRRHFCALGIRNFTMIPPRPDLAPDGRPAGSQITTRTRTRHVADIWRTAAAAAAPAACVQPYLHRLSGGAPVCLLHPGSGSPLKNWPLAGFMALADTLQRHDLKPVFILGEAETDMLPALRDKWPVIWQPSLLMAAGILTAATRYVGNDSGISHLSAILGAPTVALFGPTDPAVWGPRGRQVHIIRGKTGGAIENIGLAEVLEKIINCGSEKTM
ncbi:MAG: glycosyltransferase family 9 protein [Kiritimatiellia bacterium]